MDQGTPTIVEACAAVLDLVQSAPSGSDDEKTILTMLAQFSEKVAKEAGMEWDLVTMDAKASIGDKDKDQTKEEEEDEDNNTPVAQLRTITLGLSEDYSVAKLGEARDRFMFLLTEFTSSDSSIVIAGTRQVRLKAGNVLRFNASEVVTWANFVFFEMLGPQALMRIKEMVKFVNEPIAGDPAVVQRAKILSKDLAIPAKCRTFFAAYGMMEENDTTTNLYHRALMGNIARLDLFDSYVKLLEDVRNKKPEMMDELRKTNIQPGQGKRNATLVRRYVEIRLNCEGRTVVSNNLSQAQSIVAFADIWGPGVLLLLPSNACKFLQNSGVEKANVAAGALKEVLGGEPMSIICKFLEKKILKALRCGDRVDINIAGVRAGPLAETLLNSEVTT